MCFTNRFLIRLAALMLVLVWVAGCTPASPPDNNSPLDLGSQGESKTPESEAGGVPDAGEFVAPGKGTVVEIEGIPAIEPQTADVPSFAEDAVLGYLKRNPSFGKGEIVQLDTAQVECTTAKVVSDRLHGADMGVADDRLVCLVTMDGVFIFTGPYDTQPATFAKAFMLFDSQTGNLLVAGALEK